jgi:hypothetical protein
MSRQLQHHGKRPKTRHARSYAAGEAFGELIVGQPSSNGEAQDQCLYIIRGHPEDGDYLCAVEHNEWVTCRLHFIWTNDRDKAQVFTEKQLEAIAPHIVAGYSGTKQIRIL